MVKVFAPGRTELAGNHTDHQLGRVLASAVNFGLTAECSKNNDNVIRIKSVGYDPFTIKINDLKPNPSEYGKSIALVRGVLASSKELGLDVAGFDATITSTLPAGSGLSSSAAYSVLIGKIVDTLFNGDSISPVAIAKIAQRAENVFFGKPCGLMDQLASAEGKCVYIDFKTMDIMPITTDFAGLGLTLCLTNTGGSHAGLDSSYAMMPKDMVRIANMFDKGVLGDVDPKEFWAKNWSKESRPVRRAMHFFGENERVPKMRDALIKKDGNEYMKLMNESGRSSEELLNNIVTSASKDTKLAEGLELSRKLLDGKGAWRVHGGGFAGCVQALMPTEYFPEYKNSMEAYFGENTCTEIVIP